MVFRWDAKFRDVRYPGAFTGLLNDRRGDWRVLLDTTHGFSYRDVHDSTRVLVDARMIASNTVYTVTVDRISAHRTRMALEEGNRFMCDVEVADLKSYRSCYFSVLQDNGGALSAKNIWVDNVSFTPKDGLPEETCLGRSFPNPFNGGTWIEYDLKRKSPVRILVFDVSGRLTVELEHRAVEAGHHRVFWNGTDRFGRRATSGVYCCAFETPGLNQSVKLVLLR
jgi:hypothetical protein